MDNINIRLLGDKSIVTFRGALNINHIVSLKQEIDELVSFETDLEVYLEAPESIDITFIQLLVAMQNSCRVKGTAFQLKSQLSDDIIGLLKNAGLEELFNI